ncbi:MAG: hypothetical protein FWD01_01100 [Defluviitaleaceae bacterium]|nr:hypothetical protein [Defluviitaleaceae bacterium]
MSLMDELIETILKNKEKLTEIIKETSKQLTDFMDENNDSPQLVAEETEKAIYIIQEATKKFEKLTKECLKKIPEDEERREIFLETTKQFLETIWKHVDSAVEGFRIIADVLPEDDEGN